MTKMDHPNFKGIMADSAMANWNVVQIVYGSRSFDEKLENRRGHACGIGVLLFINTHRSTLRKHSNCNILCYITTRKWMLYDYKIVPQ